MYFFSLPFDRGACTCCYFFTQCYWGKGCRNGGEGRGGRHDIASGLPALPDVFFPTSARRRSIFIQIDSRETPIFLKGATTDARQRAGDRFSFVDL